MNEYEYAYDIPFVEIKRCEICCEWIEYSKNLVIKNHKHYHRDCIINFIISRKKN